MSFIWRKFAVENLDLNLTLIRDSPYGFIDSFYDLKDEYTQNKMDWALDRVQDVTLKSLLDGLLKINPSERICSWQEVLNHNFFNGMSLHVYNDTGVGNHPFKSIVEDKRLLDNIGKKILIEFFEI